MVVHWTSKNRISLRTSFYLLHKLFLYICYIYYWIPQKFYSVFLFLSYTQTILSISNNIVHSVFKNSTAFDVVDSKIVLLTKVFIVFSKICTDLQIWTDINNINIISCTLERFFFFFLNLKSELYKYLLFLCLWIKGCVLSVEYNIKIFLICLTFDKLNIYL